MKKIRESCQITSIRSIKICECDNTAPHIYNVSGAAGDNKHRTNDMSCSIQVMKYFRVRLVSKGGARWLWWSFRSRTVDAILPLGPKREKWGQNCRVYAGVRNSVTLYQAILVTLRRLPGGQKRVTGSFRMWPITMQLPSDRMNGCTYSSNSAPSSRYSSIMWPATGNMTGVRVLIRVTTPRPPLEFTHPKVSRLAACSGNCKWYNSLPLGAVVSLFYESV